MTDLLSTLPAFPTKPHAHLLPSLEKNHITTTDLLTLDALEIAKRARLPLLDVRRLVGCVVAALHGELGVGAPDGGGGGSDGVGGLAGLRRCGADVVRRWRCISTLDERLDEALGGGVPMGYITEFAGESATGKSQLLLLLSLATQLPPPHGVSKSTLYISTEAPLSTPRLSQLLRSLQTRFPDRSTPISMDRVYSILCADLEAQEHILYYQVEVAVKRYGVGLVVLDSVAANFRAEFERGGDGGGGGVGEGVNMAKRSADLLRLGRFLTRLARDHDIAVVVANQVSDRFSSNPIPIPTPTPSTSTSTILTLDHQQRWFTGWGDTSTNDSPGSLSPKTPSLGLTWANCLSARIALIKEPVYGAGAEGEKELLRWRRWMKVVFAPWVEGGDGREVEFVIAEEGVSGVSGV
ncbi:MAG: hypothetical protein M1840_000070 [Geoglossum simile]|nr:MAG: hypothetical protein M1840_000070 [Geoglossum simile]